MPHGDDYDMGPLTKQAASFLCDMLLDMPGEQVRRVLIGANLARTSARPNRFVIHMRDLEEAKRTVERGDRSE